MRTAAPTRSDAPLLLKPGRWAIGSAAASGFRIVAPGIQSRHALIVCGPKTIVLRAWDPRTWRNGQPVCGEVALLPGDHLKLGSAEFVVEADQTGQPWELRPCQPDESIRYPIATTSSASVDSGDDESLQAQIEELRQELSQRVNQPIPEVSPAFESDETDSL